MNKMTVRDADFAGKRVLMRVDFNVPVADGTVTDDTRIRAAVPTIKHIMDQKPRSIALMSHLGRPKSGPEEKFSMKPVVSVLAEYLGIDVAFADDVIGDATEKAVADLPEGGVILLENTRFHKGETKNDEELAAQMAKHGDVFVNDAFGTAHRAHASNVGVSGHLPAYAGLLMEKEIDYLATAIESPESPFIAILGGAKVSDKIAVIEALLGKVDKLLIGGGLANTFLAAKAYEMGNSLVEGDAVQTAMALLDKGGDKLVLPTDAVIGNQFSEEADTRTIIASEGVPEGWSIYDIGAETIVAFGEVLANAKTVVWNGPMGVFEIEKFAVGTHEIAKMLVTATEGGATTIIGGGDSAAAIEGAGLADKVSHVSTGGGASLEMLEGKVLPGLAAIQDK